MTPYRRHIAAAALAALLAAVCATPPAEAPERGVPTAETDVLERVDTLEAVVVDLVERRR